MGNRMADGACKAGWPDNAIQANVVYAHNYCMLLLELLGSTVATAPILSLLLSAFFCLAACESMNCS